MGKENILKEVKALEQYEAVKDFSFSDKENYLAFDVCLKADAVRSVGDYVNFIVTKVCSICDDEERIQIEMKKHLPDVFNEVQKIKEMDVSRYAKDSQLEGLFNRKYEALKRYSGLKDLF